MLRTQLFSPRSCDDITDTSNARARRTAIRYDISGLAVPGSAAPEHPDLLHNTLYPPATLFAALWVLHRCQSLVVARRH